MMMQHIRDPRMLAAAVVAGLAMIVLALAFTWRAHDQEKLRHLARSNCEQIEELKTEFREEAVEDFKNLERNGRLLGIEITPDLRATALFERDRTLTRFAPAEC